MHYNLSKILNKFANLALMNYLCAYLFKMRKYFHPIIIALLAVLSVPVFAQNRRVMNEDGGAGGRSLQSLGGASSMQGNTNRGQNRSSSDDSNSSSEDDPCNPRSDERYCWRLDPLTGNIYKAIPDTSYIGLCNHDVMESKAMAVAYTSNLYGPHLINQYFSRRDDSDFIFANAYSLFAEQPGDVLYYNTKIPFTVASYGHSGATMQANDHLLIDFAGNAKPNIGLGTKLDYVYARGEYVSSATKPLKWISYAYYTGDQYKAYASFNLSKFANQEWGGVAERDYVLHPDNYNKNFTTPRTMATQLSDTWNDTDYRNIHFTHSYDLGKWHEMHDEKDTTNVWDEFTPVATIFHSIDFQKYHHSFRMNPGADQTDNGFFAHNYYNAMSTADSTSYTDFSTYAGIRLNEGFNKYSQFGISAFIGYERQTFTMLVDSLDLDFIKHKHVSNNVWIGGQLSRHLSSALTFDITAKTAISGDKIGDFDINGQIQTVIPFGRKNPETGLRRDSITIQANGYIRNNRPSYMLNHYFSNHFKWNQDLDRTQKVHIDGLISYSRTGTSVRAGIEHINKYVYFSAEDFIPRQYDKQLDVFSLEVRQNLNFSIFNWNNAVLVQTSTNNDVLALPAFSLESDFSMRFCIARTLHAQLGVTGYYNSKYYAPTYQPATQQFAMQQEIKCGGFPNLTGYLNCNLKRIKFFVMMTNLLNGAVTADTFIMPDYPMMPRRFEWGVTLDLQN